MKENDGYSPSFSLPEELGQEDNEEYERKQTELTVKSKRDQICGEDEESSGEGLKHYYRGEETECEEIAGSVGRAETHVNRAVDVLVEADVAAHWLRSGQISSCYY